MYVKIARQKGMAHLHSLLIKKFVNRAALRAAALLMAMDEVPEEYRLKKIAK